jgi:D-alanyl-D-alanine carboxypeptidase
VIALQTAVLGATLALSPDQVARIDAVVRTVMSGEHIAGLSLGVARNGRTLFMHGYGVRDVASGARADAFTIYRIGSITKQFTAALVLQAAQRGALSLDTQEGDATVRELLAQTPGGVWRYDNANYVRLANVLQASSHTGYSDLLRQSILVPLGLISTSYALPRARNVAAGYRYEDGAFVPVPYEIRDTPEEASGAAAMSSNVRDLLHWMQALQSGNVVSPESFREMTASQQLPSGKRTGYGFGFFVQDWYGIGVAEHPGNLDGFSGNDAIVPEDGLEIAVLSNADRVDLVPLTKSVLAIVDGPKDANLYADHPRPPENEDAAVTRMVTRVFEQREHCTPNLVEFIERTHAEELTYEKYRVTCGVNRYWVTLGLHADLTIDSVSVQPDNY